MKRDTFAWGAATSAFQIEGATSEDGRKKSVWDVFCEREGRIKNGENADVACDHYHRYREDVRLVRDLGANSYRFSVSWPRVLPDGRGKVNAKGLDFYDRLTDELLANGVTPWLTLFHWDLPQELQKRGGMENPDFADWFAEYARVVTQRLGDRVKHYMTFNEPQSYLQHGCVSGLFAPGLQLGESEAFEAAHHLLQAHGRATDVIRDGSSGAAVGTAPCGDIYIPAREDGGLYAAVREMTFENPALDSFGWFTDAAVLGEYPRRLTEKFPFLGEWMARDRAVIARPLDFSGVNVYFGRTVDYDAAGNLAVLPNARVLNMSEWPLDERCIYYIARYFHDRYRLPVVVTENGVTANDEPSLDGKVHDATRVNFLERQIAALRRAAADGADVAGYFAWSLLDNFEWRQGYYPRFGMVYVDFGTQKRIPKDSYYRYREIIREKGGKL